MPSKTYIETTLAVLHLYGCDPTKPNNIFIYTNKVCIILASLMMLTLGTTYYFLNQNGIPLQDLVKLVDSFITPIQVFVIILTMIINKLILLHYNTDFKQTVLVDDVQRRYRRMLGANSPVLVCKRFGRSQQEESERYV